MMKKAFVEFQENLSMAKAESEKLYEDLLQYRTLYFGKSAIENRIFSKVMEIKSLEEVKYISQHVLTGSELNKILESRIDFLEGKPSDLELYLESLAKNDSKASCSKEEDMPSYDVLVKAFEEYRTLTKVLATATSETLKSSKSTKEEKEYATFVNDCVLDGNSTLMVLKE